MQIVRTRFMHFICNALTHVLQLNHCIYEQVENAQPSLIQLQDLVSFGALLIVVGLTSTMIQ